MPALPSAIRLAAAIAALTSLAAVPGASAAPRSLTPSLRGVLSIDAFRSQAVITRPTSKGTTKLRLVTASGSRDLPTEPGMAPGASIGTDAQGRPVLVFQRCGKPWDSSPNATNRDVKDCTVRTAGIDGRGERKVDLGLRAGVDWGIHGTPRMSGGRLAFIARSTAAEGIFIKRPGQPAALAVEDRDPFPIDDDTNLHIVTTEIDYQGDVLLEYREGSSVGGQAKLVRVRRLGRAPRVVARLETRYTDPNPFPVLESSQLENGTAYWVARSRIGRVAPAAGGRVTSAPRGSLGPPLVAVGGTQIFAARKLRSGGWTVVTVPLPRFR